MKNIYRPSHADYAWEAKYGFRDYRGGGRSSGRETLCRVAAGSVAKKLLSLYGINIRAWTSSVAGIDLPDSGEDGFNFDDIDNNIFRVPSMDFVPKINSKIEEIRKDGDSAGGIISCIVKGVKAGLGEPVFDKLDARLASSILSIGACKGIEFGSGFAAASKKGSENNDAPAKGSYEHSAKNCVKFASNNSGGILGGISTGQDIFFKAVFKPTPSISKRQKVFDKDLNIKEIEIKGRHDVCIVPRAVPVVEAMAAIVLADFMLLSRISRI